MSVADPAIPLVDAAPGADPLDAARVVLRRYWGYPDFRPGQDQAIRNVLSGGDSLTIMPTGGGKSLCYQVPGTLLPGVTLVVSPLISLMKDHAGTRRQRYRKCRHEGSLRSNRAGRR